MTSVDPSTALARLRQAVITQKKAALPVKPPTELQPLHTLLNEYDRFVSQIVISPCRGYHRWL
jgi:hypothetical protein